LFGQKHSIGNTHNGHYFFFSKLIAAAIIVSVVAGYRALLESNPSTPTIYTG
jgi:hypothetical protein